MERTRWGTSIDPGGAGQSVLPRASRGQPVVSEKRRKVLIAQPARSMRAKARQPLLLFPAQCHSALDRLGPRTARLWGGSRPIHMKHLGLTNDIGVIRR